MHALRRKAVSIALATGVAVAAGGGVARAQPSPDMRAAAAALFEDGRSLMASGKHAAACPKLEESQRIDPGMGTLFNLASCYEAIGRTASAWVGFRDVAGMALAAGQPEREKAARARVGALEPKLIRLKIAIPPGGTAVEVKRDGAVVSPALWGTALPLDPGPHEVSASAPGKQSWVVNVRLDQPGATVNVDIPALVDKPAVAESAAVAPSPASEPAPSGPRAWQTPLGVAVTVLGAAGLGVGTALGFLAKSAFDASNQSTSQTGASPLANCSKTTNKCNAAGLAQRNDAVTKANAGTGVFVAGAVLAAAGIVVWVTAPRSSAPKVGLGPTGVTLGADW